MKRLIFIALALIIPVLIWWVESKIAKRKGINVVERKIKPEEMEKFEGCFLTGTAAEVTPVSQINDFKFNVCNLITDLNNAYQNLVRKKILQLNLYYLHL